MADVLSSQASIRMPIIGVLKCKATRPLPHKRSTRIVDCLAEGIACQEHEPLSERSLHLELKTIVVCAAVVIHVIEIPPSRPALPGLQRPWSRPGLVQQLQVREMMRCVSHI